MTATKPCAMHEADAVCKFCEKKPELPIAPRLIALDETRHWNLITCPHADLVERIETVYLYDANMHTHLCEAEPSYFLVAMETRVIYRFFNDSNWRDEAQAWVDGAAVPEDIYMHVSEIDRLAKELSAQPYRTATLPDVPVLEDETREEVWEDVFEDEQGSPSI